MSETWKREVWNPEKRNPKLIGHKFTSEEMKGNKYALGKHWKMSKEGRENIGNGHRGLHLSEQARKNMVNSSNSGRFTSERTKGERNPFFGKSHSKEAKEQNRLKHLGGTPWNKGKALSEEHLRAVLKANFIKPNKAEQKLDALLQKVLPNEYKYVGNGEFILGGKCPDFLNVNGKKKLIELFGIFWHKGDDPQDRIDFFKIYGFNTLVVWENELNDADSLSIKLLGF